YNLEASGHGAWTELAVFVRDDAGELAAGIDADVWSDCCEVNLLWVHESERGNGTGSRLLTAIEDEARARGCTRMVLDTFSFQAKPFYERHGYELVGSIPGFPKGHEWYSMTKRL
ncbi:MAG: GNAT family N-acetyltransferase, partial [Actinomycetota bacterium]